MPYYSRKTCKYLQEYLILPGCFKFAVQILIQNTSISHAKRQNFNRAPNFVSVPWLWTIQNTSIFPGKNTPQSTISTEQILTAAFKSLFFLEREKQKIFFIAPEAVVMRCSVNKAVLKNFTKFAGKHLCQSLSFNKVPGLRLWHKCFPVNFVKISWTPSLKMTSGGCFYSSSVLDTLETL